MTIAAGLLRDGTVMGLDLQRIGERAGRERERVPEPVRGFREVLADEIVRHVAVGATGDSAMARALPGTEVLFHDVTVRADGRIGAEVRRPFRIDEGERAKAHGRAGQCAGKNNPSLLTCYHIEPKQPTAGLGKAGGDEPDSRMAGPHTQSTPQRAAGSTREMGLGRVELPTSRLSGVRSNHLSYRPLGQDWGTGG